MTDIPDVNPLQMVFPCMFYRMASFECALCRYGLGMPIRDAIRHTVDSVFRGLKQKRPDFQSINGTKLDNIAFLVEKKFITQGSDNIVEPIVCFGLLKIGDQFVCGPHNLWFNSSFQEVIPFLIESSEGTYGCLCYLAALVTKELLEGPK